MVVAVLLLLLTLGGCGFAPLNVEGDSALRFDRLPIHYKISSSIPSEYHEEIKAAFEEWNTATQTQVFVFDGFKDLQEDQLDPAYTWDENVVLATNQIGNIDAPNAPPARAGTGPLARTFLKGATAIRDADIYLFEFDSNYVRGRPETGDVYSIRSVVLHEAGHMLFGPDHSTDEASIMTAQLYPRGHEKEKLTLGDVDISHFFEIYGNEL